MVVDAESIEVLLRAYSEIDGYEDDQILKKTAPFFDKDQKEYIKFKDIQVNLYSLQFNRTWFSNLKWKPVEDNSIDFRVSFMRDSNQEYIDKMLNYLII